MYVVIRQSVESNTRLHKYLNPICTSKNSLTKHLWTLLGIVQMQMCKHNQLVSLHLTSKIRTCCARNLQAKATQIRLDFAMYVSYVL